MGAFNNSDFYTVLITHLTNHTVLEVVVYAVHYTIDILKEEKKPLLFRKIDLSHSVKIVS